MTCVLSRNLLFRALCQVEPDSTQAARAQRDQCASPPPLMDVELDVACGDSHRCTLTRAPTTDETARRGPSYLFPLKNAPSR